MATIMCKHSMNSGIRSDSNVNAWTVGSIFVTVEIYRLF